MFSVCDFHARDHLLGDGGGAAPLWPPYAREEVDEGQKLPKPTSF